MPTLCCFDIDGTLADGMCRNGHTVADILAMRPHPNIVRLVVQAIERDDTEVMFCTGRPKSHYAATWRWLNRQVRLTDTARRVTLVCRPNDTATAAIPQYKLHELVQAVRRQPVRPVELRCYEDSVQNLRLFQTLRPIVSRLRLYRCDDGVAALWKLGDA